MTSALILMKAMPPTIGHQDLINFANQLADEVSIIMDYKSDEPMIGERAVALMEMLGSDYVFVEQAEIQDPIQEGFWEQWETILKPWVGEVDYVVASETYGDIIAKMVGAKFMPYDINRTLNPVKATDIRNDPSSFFTNIAKPFRRYLRTTVTVFGAESTGKSTLTKGLADGWWQPSIFEYARPYLETIGPEINIDSMNGIWQGQRALQETTMINNSWSMIFQDTDLFSTVGYWEQPHWREALGPVPSNLLMDADRLKSDLYIITRSNIPFEEDPLRYGGDKRESPDEFWIGIAEKYKLNYVVLDSDSLDARLDEASKHIYPIVKQKLSKIKYDRKGL